MCIAAALADGESQLGNVLDSGDLARTRAILEAAFGARFVSRGSGDFVVRGVNFAGGRVCGPVVGMPLNLAPLDLDVGESGTTCRLLMAVLAAGQGHFRLHGQGRMHERPVADLAAPLRSLGVHITYEQREGCLPLRIESSGFAPSLLSTDSGGMVTVSCDESSQYLSGLLLAAPLGVPSDGGLTILLGGSSVVSWPYVVLTLDILERFGIAFAVEQRQKDAGWERTDWRSLPSSLKDPRPGKLRFRVSHGPYRPGRHVVEGDWSGASYFLAAGAIGPKPVRVEGLNPDSLQGDAAVQDVLLCMGARLKKDGSAITAYPAALRGIEADLKHCPDLAPTVAALAAHADCPTVIRGAAHLKIKESNRIAALGLELRKAGCEVSMTDDGLIIVPPAGGPRLPEGGSLFSSHHDHRIAMSVALLGLPGLRGGKGFEPRLDDPACVAKSLPRFWDLWRLLY
jgi:3-phosphoshikimate 1-carboxyvinyltransferase